MSCRSFYPFVIIGDGVASNALLFELRQRSLRNFKEESILQIAAPKLVKAASENHTGLVSLAKIKKGVSPLGDLLVRSYHHFEEWVERQGPEGVARGRHYNVAVGEGEQREWRRQWGDPQPIQKLEEVGLSLSNPLKGKVWPCYFVKPHAYLSWLRNEHGYGKNKLSHFVQKITYTEKYHRWNIHTLEGKNIQAKVLILTTGALSKVFENMGCWGLGLEQTSIVAGSYLHFPSVDWGKMSFAFSLGRMNLIYKWGELTLGATTDRGGIVAPPLASLKSFYKSIQKCFGAQLHLPPFEQGQIKTALRHKGKRRLPFWGAMDRKRHLYGIHSLYKNGLSTSLLAASELAEQIVAVNHRHRHRHGL